MKPESEASIVMSSTLSLEATDATVETTARRRSTLLVCDDEEGPRDSLRIIFKGEYDVLCASNGPEAIELAQQNRVDVAVCDIRMSGMSGIEVLERLKFVDPTIEVVMMTAFETTDTLRQALRLQGPITSTSRSTSPRCGRRWRRPCNGAGWNAR